MLDVIKASFIIPLISLFITFLILSINHINDNITLFVVYFMVSVISFIVAIIDISYLINKYLW